MIMHFQYLALTYCFVVHTLPFVIKIDAPLLLMFNCAPVLLSRPTHTLSPQAGRSVWVTFWTSNDSTGAPFTNQTSKWRTK